MSTKTDFWPEPGGKDYHEGSAILRNPSRAVETLLALHAEGGPQDFEQAIGLFMALHNHIKAGGAFPDPWESYYILNQRLQEALKFYADPENYHAVSFTFDPPCGGFAHDFSDAHGHPDYDRPMPGNCAREALKELDDEDKD